MLLHQLFNQFILAADFFLKDINDKVLGRKHILQIASQGIEAIMRTLLSLLLENTHSALIARVGALALILLMGHYVNTLHILVAVDAGDQNVWTRSLVHVDLSPQTLCFALLVRFTLYRLEFTELVMRLNHRIAQHLTASELFILAHELHRVQLFLYFFLD